jgi:hypothetical protein
MTCSILSAIIANTKVTNWTRNPGLPHGGERAFRRRSRRRSVLGLNVQEETFFGVGGGSLMVAKPGEVFKCAKLQACETTSARQLGTNGVNRQPAIPPGAYARMLCL